MDNAICRYDIEGLALELGVEFEELSGLYSTYFREMRNEITSIMESMKKDDWYMVERIIHNIKGVSANLRIYDVFSQIQEFHQLLKKGDAKSLYTCIETIIRLIRNAENDIKTFFALKGCSG